MDNPQVMLKFFKKLAAEGYTVPKSQSDMLANFYTKWNAMRKNATSLFGLATQTEQRNFYQLTHRPNPEKDLVTPFITTENGLVYLCLPFTANKGNQSVIRTVRVPGIKFMQASPQLIRYFSGPVEAVGFIKKLLAAGVSLNNEASLHKQFTALRREIPKATKMTMEEFFGNK
jgi:hypothetical protein